MLRPLGSTLRVIEPVQNVLAFYDGRLPGARLHAETENWLDDGAYALGIASYAVVDGNEGLIYDTHISLPHARLIRAELERRGVQRLRVVLSHWHDDHVAGNAVFADCEIIANQDTAALLRTHQGAMEAADPPISPLVHPATLFTGALDLTVGTVPVRLQAFDIHSRDGTVALLPDGVLLAGDTLEDPITYVDEPDRLAVHLGELERLASLDVRRILPNHGSFERIAAGGYPPDLIEATRLYVQALTALAPGAPGTDAEKAARAALPLEDFAADAFATGAIDPFSPYEAVHRRNVERVRAEG